ncbi:hypothetical protein BVI1335_70100 [Burkholderia vietnamiensis]|nr:hypothetical protein BVI1335_70100 [Burkholderia vietnamiensis]
MRVVCAGLSWETCGTKNKLRVIYIRATLGYASHRLDAYLQGAHRKRVPLFFCREH